MKRQRDRGGFVANTRIISQNEERKPSSNFNFRGTVKKPQILLAYLCYFNMLDLITLNINTIF